MYTFAHTEKKILEKYMETAPFYIYIKTTRNFNIGKKYTIN